MLSLTAFIAGITGILIIFLAILETAGMNGFWPYVYRVGIPVKRFILKKKGHHLPLPESVTVQRDTGIFRLSGATILFHPRLLVSGMRSAFPFKGTASLAEGEEVVVTARLPVGSTLFLLFWVILWLLAIFLFGGGSEPDILLTIGIFGIVGVAVLAGISYAIEQKRFADELRELQQLLDDPEIVKTYAFPQKKRR